MTPTKQEVEEALKQADVDEKDSVQSILAAALRAAEAANEFNLKEREAYAKTMLAREAELRKEVELLQVELLAEIVGWKATCGMANDSTDIWKGRAEKAEAENAAKEIRLSQLVMERDRAEAENAALKSGKWEACERECDIVPGVRRENAALKARLELNIHDREKLQSKINKTDQWLSDNNLNSLGDVENTLKRLAPAEKVVEASRHTLHYLKSPASNKLHPATEIERGRIESAIAAYDAQARINPVCSRIFSHTIGEDCPKCGRKTGAQEKKP